jgi:hypothetical protein
LDNLKIRVDEKDNVNFMELPQQSGIITFWMDQNFVQGGIKIPNGSTWQRSEIRLWPTLQPLNEFGYLYVALYIVGNYA